MKERDQISWKADQVGKQWIVLQITDKLKMLDSFTDNLSSGPFVRLFVPLRKQQISNTLL